MISDRIRDLRGTKTQKEFADIIGIKQGLLSDYENNKVKPTTDFYIAVIKKLNVNLNWLLTGVGSQYIPADCSTDNYIDILIEENKSLKYLAGKSLEQIKSVVSDFSTKINNVKSQKIKKK